MALKPHFKVTLRPSFSKNQLISAKFAHLENDRVMRLIHMASPAFDLRSSGGAFGGKAALKIGKTISSRTRDDETWPEKQAHFSFHQLRIAWILINWFKCNLPGKISVPFNIIESRVCRFVQEGNLSCSRVRLRVLGVGAWWFLEECQSSPMQPRWCIHQGINVFYAHTESYTEIRSRRLLKFNSKSP